MSSNLIVFRFFNYVREMSKVLILNLLFRYRKICLAKFMFTLIISIGI